LKRTATPASADATSPVVGYTYVDDNTTPANTIAGFDRHADGSLSPIPGSPFPAGGMGLGSGLASQGAIQVTSDGRYLLAVDAGSNQVSVLRITDDGVPVLVGQPVPSGGARPVSVAVSWTGLVYVANQGPGGSGYSGFRLHFDGSLTPVPGSTVTVPDGSGVGDVFFNAFGNLLIGTRTGTSMIDSFVVLPGGRLLNAPGSPFTGQGLGQLGAEFSPTRPWQLFVSNAHNGAGLGTVSAYNDIFSQLRPIGPSPYADSQTAPCWVEISHDGRYLFTVNTGSASISSYSINPDVGGVAHHQDGSPFVASPVRGGHPERLLARSRAGDLKLEDVAAKWLEVNSAKGPNAWAMDDRRSGSFEALPKSWNRAPSRPGALVAGNRALFRQFA